MRVDDGESPFFGVTKDVVDRGEGDALGSHGKACGSRDREESGHSRLEMEIAEVTIPTSLPPSVPLSA